MLLEVDNLRVAYPGTARPAVAGVSLALERGESLGVVGASGSGKTQTALALLGLLPPDARVSGSVRCAGVELLGQGERVLNRFRARRIAMVFQDPGSALNPCLTIGRQLQQVLLRHRRVRRGRWRSAAQALLERARLPDPAHALGAYPHQLSGGMRQRAMIALALAGQPDVLVADEPTTALDVTVQAGVLALLSELREREGIGLMLITHDLGVIAHSVERMLVLHEGRPIEEGPTLEVFRRPVQGHTRELIAAAPRLDVPGPPAPPQDAGQALLSIERVSVTYPARRAARHGPAVCDVSVGVGRGETLAIVGESGSGKTTLARAITGLVTPDAGHVALSGVRLAPSLKRRRPALRRRLQMVFQDPVASLDPAMTVAEILAEPLRLAGGHDPDRLGQEIAASLARVGLDSALHGRRPHELSGGQAQRVAIARALAADPAVLVCDEAVAALDGGARQQVLDVLRAGQQAAGLALVFISHDLAVVRRIAHRVAVMYAGRICELADADALFGRPRHPYTRALLAAVPVPDPEGPPPEAPAVPGGAPPAGGCAWQPRCRYAVARCAMEVPPLTRSDDGRLVACHRTDEIEPGG